MIHIKGGLFWNIEQGGIFLGSFCVSMNVHQRRCTVVREGLVKVVVIFCSQLGLGPLPQSTGTVDLVNLIFLASYIALVVILILAVVQVNGEGNVVAVSLYQFLYLPAAGIFLAFIIQGHDNGCTVSTFTVKLILLGFFTIKSNALHLVGASSVAGPVEQGVGGSLTGIHVNAGSGHKCGIKSYTKLTDKGGILLCIGGKSLQKGLCSRASNGSQVCGQFITVHTDSCVPNHQHTSLFLKADVNARIKDNALVGIVREGQVFELVQCVGSVGNNLPQKNVLVGVQGMDDEGQKLVYFCLKLIGCHLFLLCELLKD